MTGIPVDQIAKLSGLTVSDDEARTLEKVLDETLSYVNNLQELDVESVDASSSVSGSVNRYFEDGTPQTRSLPQSTYKVARVL